MATPLRVLIVEDTPDEADLMVLRLRDAGMQLDWERVESEADYLAGLAKTPDLILCDWRLPKFSGLRALGLMRARGLDIPFVIVSGSIGEEAAIDALRQGAYDYVLKDRPARLAPAVRHALDDKLLREQRRAAEAALRESEERYRTLVSDLPVGVYRTSEDHRILDANPALAALLGYDSPDDLIGQDASNFFVNPDDQARWREDVLQGRLRLNEAESQQRRKDGSLVWVSDSGRAIRAADGQLLHFQGTLTDISERKRAEAALRESEERYRAVVRSARDAIITTDSDGTIVAWNPGAEHMFGYTEAEFTGQPLARLLPARSVAGHTAGMERMRSGGEGKIVGRTLEAEGVRKDGQVFPLEVSLSEWQLADERFYTAIIRDITERKKAEEALRNRASEMEALYRTSLEILARNDLPELLAAIVETATRLTGGDRGALYLPTADGARLRLDISYNLGRDYRGTELEMGEGVSGRAALERRVMMIENYDAWPGKSAKFRDSGIGRVLAMPMLVGDRLVGVLNVADRNQGPYGEEEIRLVGLFADQAAIAMESARLLEETLTHAAYLEALTSAAAALRATAVPEEMYAIVLESVVLPLKVGGATLVLLDEEGREVTTVAAVGVLQPTIGLRLPVGQGIGGTVVASGKPFVSEDIRADAHLVRADLLQDITAVACVPLTVEDETIGCIMVGRQAPLSAEEVRLLTGLAEIAGNAIHRARVMATLEDRVRVRTRELEAANERLTDLDRMKTEFVSNVTHELRTPITNILLYLDLARRTESGSKRAHYFEVLKAESVRLGRLIEEVLTLSRLERGAAPTDREPHPLDALLADVIVAHRARADVKGIGLEHEPDATLPIVSIQRSQIHQVLTNLVGNAVAYTPPGGHIRLSTTRTRVDEREFAGAVVHNTGSYIPPEEMEHLFQRFYRGSVGRASGETGTGLGLAISKEIVELHHGWIDVESSKQAGTTFTVWLPLASDGWDTLAPRDTPRPPDTTRP